MYRGQKVEVNHIVMSGGYTGKHTYAWARGYTYVREDGKSHLVRATQGVSQGCLIRFSEVRPISKKTQ